MKKNLHRIIVVFVALMLGSIAVYAQNVNIEDIANIRDRKTFKLNGGISANSTFFNANEMHGRQAFTWQLNGNLNISILELMNIPVSINLNNFGAQYSYPSLPNRLSLHPSYKWVRAHIGDVSMSFSPYTLGGHLFTGGGVELTPGKWHIAAMGGRLVREVNYNPELPSIPPSYNRWGTGARVRYNGGRYFIGGSVFTAKDSYKEISFQADSLGIFPMSNAAASFEGGLNITSNLRLSVEYALSHLTRDTRPLINASTPLSDHTEEGGMVGERGSAPLTNPSEAREGTTHLYHAVKASLDYTFYRNTIGLGYERIDPEYRTLGAYFFNNDYENFTLNYARPLFNNRGNLALSGGVQRDDLNDAKESKNTRFVGSANLTYSPADNLNLSLSTSTFQGHRVIKSQFDYINQTRPYENLDTLNFTQISQSIDFNLNWTIGNSEKASQNISFFTSYQEAADRQGKLILPGNLNRFLNAAAIYGIDVASLNTFFNLGVNVSNNYSNLRNFLTAGPTFAANVRLLEGKLMTGTAVSYNRSYDQSVPMADVFNVRWNANTRVFNKHTLQASAMLQHQKRMMPTVNKTRTFTLQMGYMYNF
jgi:hypothetical protein